MRFTNLKDSRILIVDDQVINLRALTTVLEFAGCDNVRCLGDSRQVLPVFAEFQPDLIVLDLHMPHLDGLAVMDQLTMVISKDDYLPVLVITGDSTPKAKEKALSRGASDFLSKPLNHTEVELRIKNLLQTRWLHRQLKEQNVSLEQQVRESDKQAEEMRAFLGSIVESSDDSIIGSTLDGTIRTWNQGAQRLFGYTPEEAIGKCISMLFLPGHQSDYLNTRDKIRRNERVERFEAVRVAKGGVPMNISAIISPIKDKTGRLIGVSGIYQDITQRKLEDAQLLKVKEAAEAANKAKSEFLANMSHEIRTPMNGVIAMTELALDTELTQEQREYISTVKSSAESLLAIINDILDFSRIEVRKLTLERQAFELRPVIDATIQEMAIHAQIKSLIFSADIRPEVSNVVYGDRGRLRQVLVNLIGNAIKFTDAGQVAVKVEPFLETRDLLHFQIRDTGIGIPPDMHAIIFDAFTQVDGCSTRKFGGTGLGLAITAQLVEMMGGRVWVESDARTGSTFHFTACLAPVEL